MTDIQIQQIVQFCDRLADASREVVMRYFRRPYDIEHKEDDSPVTIADRGAEQAMRALIADAYPNHGVFGEEFGRQLGGRYTWVLDPIDGTKSFISGFPTFGTLISLLDGEAPIVGTIDAPALGERWVGAVNYGAFYCHDKPCQTSRCNDITAASLFSTSIDMFNDPELSLPYQRLSQAVRMRRFGGDCYSYGMLALGYIDLVVEAQMEPYDFLALAPIIGAAGGVISDFRGDPLTLNSRGTVVAAANGELHRQAIAILNAS